MAGLLHDPKLILQIVAILIAICIPFTVFYLNKRRDQKGLSYGISVLDITTIHYNYESKVQVFFEGHPAPKTRLIVVNIKNSGKAPIKSSDFEGALQLKMPRGARVLSMEVTEQSPEGLNAKLTLETEGSEDSSERQDRVKLLPLLLNGGDSLNIEVIASHVSTKEIIVEARIVGIANIEKRIKGATTQVTFEGSVSSAWSWTRFAWGCLGACLVEAFRAYRIVGDNAPPVTTELLVAYMMTSTLLIVIGGAFASAWGADHPIKCIYAGATFPLWLSGWTHVVGDIK